MGGVTGAPGVADAVATDRSRCHPPGGLVRRRRRHAGSGGRCLARPAGWRVLGCVCALWLSFADESDPAMTPFHDLALAAGSIALGSATRLVLHDFPPTVLDLVCRYEFRHRHVHVGRQGADPFRRASAPSRWSSPRPLQFQLIDALVRPRRAHSSGIARLIDHALGGPLAQHASEPAQSLRPAAGSVSPWPTPGRATCKPVDRSPSIRARALWVAVTTMLVMQPDARASYVRVVERIVKDDARR